MASQTIQAHRENTEIFHGDSLCKKKITEMLKELSLPLGLLPIDDIDEFGYNRADGFMWVMQKKKREHTFKKIKETVSYGTPTSSSPSDFAFPRHRSSKAEWMISVPSISD